MTELHLAFDHPEQDVSGKRLIAKADLKGTAGKLTARSLRGSLVEV